MKRLISIFLSLILLLSCAPISYAASDEAVQAAQSLHELGLFNGTGINPDGTPNFDLDRAPTRQEAIVMLVRLLGKENEAKAGNWEIPFTDVDSWAEPYVGYAYTNGLTTGTGSTTFGSADAVTASQYLTFVLRALGYESGTDFQWDKAWEKSDEIGLTDGAYNATTTNFVRGDIASISESALSTKGKANNTPLLSQLAASGAIAEKAADAYFKGSEPITVERLQGIWGNYGGDNQEIIFEGNTATYMAYNSYRTVYQTGPYIITNDGKIEWTSCDNYYGDGQSPNGQYEFISFVNFSRTGYESEGFDMGNYTKVEKSTLFEKCSEMVAQYNSTLTSKEKASIAEKMKDALENQAIAGQSIQVALSYSGQLIVGSIGGMNYSKRLEAQNGMQKAELAVMASCFLAKTDIVDIRAIFEKKTGTESLVESLKTLETVYDEICNMTANTDNNQLMDMSD